MLEGENISLLTNNAGYMNYGYASTSYLTLTGGTLSGALTLNNNLIVNGTTTLVTTTLANLSGHIISSNNLPTALTDLDTRLYNQQSVTNEPTGFPNTTDSSIFPLNNFYVHHMARRISPYEIRGTGLIVSCFRALMLWDKLRESKYAQADNMVNPLTLVKIGSGDFRPSPVDLENWRNVFECYDDETEVLTNNGFQYFKDTIDYIDDNGVITSKPKDGIKIGCYNSESKKLEFIPQHQITK
ncbi:hypothetical protein AXF24_12675 [Streptococcus pneumoniae]|nr:hypothetical protein AWW74_12690 [Streptococcus pneumoniae]KXB94692.1 hypothetical protein AXF24_12675 [Streptococcus pneumoniae]